ncbi:MAG: LapA family protein [Actinomycetota bacterium]
MNRQEDEPLGNGGERVEHGGERVERGGPSPKLIASAVFALILIVFAAANFKRVEVNFLLFTTKARVVTVILVAAALGFIVGYFVGRPGRAERKRMREEGKD